MHDRKYNLLLYKLLKLQYTCSIDIPHQLAAILESSFKVLSAAILVINSNTSKWHESDYNISIFQIKR